MMTEHDNLKICPHCNGCGEVTIILPSNGRMESASCSLCQGQGEIGEIGEIEDNDKKGIADLKSSIAEFELWLEAEDSHWNWDISYQDGYDKAIENVLDKYRECKKRIEYDNDEKESE